MESWFRPPTVGRAGGARLEEARRASRVPPRRSVIPWAVAYTDSQRPTEPGPGGEWTDRSLPERGHRRFPARVRNDDGLHASRQRIGTHGARLCHGGQVLCRGQLRCGNSPAAGGRGPTSLSDGVLPVVRSRRLHHGRLENLARRYCAEAKGGAHRYLMSLAHGVLHGRGRSAAQQ